MDIREIGVDRLRGTVVGFFAPMNGGKTRAQVGELERTLHSGFNVMAYNPHSNTRDGSFIVVDGKHKFPARSVNSVQEIKEDIIYRNQLIVSRERKHQGEDGFIEIDGIRHRKYSLITTVGIDEINLFCLTEKNALEAQDFLKWCKRENMYAVVAGLIYDFRQMPFGHTHAILPYVDIHQDKKPVCKAVHQGKQCGSPASHTQRLWSVDFFAEQGLSDLVDQQELFDFADKGGRIVEDKYVAAPFFDRTVRIEEAQDGRNVYIPVCGSCSRLPYKEEVFRVYDALVRGEDHRSLVGHDLHEAIIGFLTHPQEGWIKKEEGVLVPTIYIRNRLGGFSPR